MLEFQVETVAEQAANDSEMLKGEYSKWNGSS